MGRVPHQPWGAALRVCFMREGLDHQLPQFRSRMRGDALVLTLEVDDAEADAR